MTRPSRPLDPAFVRPIAHRGLHDTGEGRVENSASAFAAAIAAGYGIECDLRPARGGIPMVFHDETLDRLTTGTGPVAALSPAELAVFPYRIGGDTVLTFGGLLALVDGVVPLLVEIKSEWTPPDADFLLNIATNAAVYAGPIALMSFDPAIVSGLAALAPNVPLGLVSGSYGLADGTDWWLGRLDPTRRARLRDLADLNAVGAAFIAYEVGALPTPTTQHARGRGLPVLAWTVRTRHDRVLARAYADAMIFEGFRP